MTHGELRRRVCRSQPSPFAEASAFAKATAERAGTATYKIVSGWRPDLRDYESEPPLHGVMDLAAEEARVRETQAADEQREKLITDHIGLVRHVVGRVVVRLPDGVDRDDLESAGIIGLIKAADRFDPARGVKFATYASAVVHGEVMEALRAKDWAPRSLRKRYRELEAAIAQLQGQLGRQPEEAEIRRALRLSEEEYQELLAETNSMAITSLEELMEREESVREAGEEGFIESQGAGGDPAEVIDQEAFKELLAEAVGQLPERDRIVIGLYYQDELTLREIGEVLEITESRVCQIHTQAVTRLRSAVNNKLAE